MAIDDIVASAKRVATHVHDYFAVPDRFNRMVDYGLNNYMDATTREAIFDGKNDEERLTLRNHLRSRIKERVEQQQQYLNRFTVKAGKGAGLVSLLNQLNYAVRDIPEQFFGSTQFALLLGKSVLELPSMYGYLKNTYDWKGALEWAGTKALSWYVPFVGAAIDYNVVPRIIRKRAIREGVQEFLEERGIERPSLYERIVDRVKRVAGALKPAYQAQPA